jgi:hypothetical protein
LIDDPLWIVSVWWPADEAEYFMPFKRVMLDDLMSGGTSLYFYCLDLDKAPLERGSSVVFGYTSNLPHTSSGATSKLLQTSSQPA